ncbi:unnamed protein product, partial [Rotaria magnacalcarata]
DHTLCECTCDFVVRYIVTIEHEDNDDDELSSIHFSVIPKKRLILINRFLLVKSIHVFM